MPQDKPKDKSKTVRTRTYDSSDKDAVKDAKMTSHPKAERENRYMSPYAKRQAKMGK